MSFFLWGICIFCVFIIIQMVNCYISVLVIYYVTHFVIDFFLSFCILVKISTITIETFDFSGCSYQPKN